MVRRRAGYGEGRMEGGIGGWEERGQCMGMRRRRAGKKDGMKEGGAGDGKKEGRLGG